MMIARSRCSPLDMAIRMAGAADNALDVLDLAAKQLCGWGEGRIDGERAAA